MQHHINNVSAPAFNGIYLDLRRGRGHYNHRAGTQFFSAQRHTLGMVTSRSANNAFGQLRCT